MGIADLRYVLPDDVDIVVDADADEVLICRTGGRRSPQVISAEAWRLVELFRTPMTVTDAVLAFSASTGEEPLRTLDAIFPILVGLSGSGVLVHSDDSVPALQPRHRLGERVGPATLTGRIRVLQDSELWHGALDDGRPAVVKVVDQQTYGPGSFAREVAALQRLAGGPVPELLWHSQSETGGVLVMSAIDGDPVDLVAAGGWATDPRRLALAVLDAYVHLQRAGVLHGDVHSGNVLADDGGRVYLIDFGLASLPGQPAPPRSSGGEQLDPQAAGAMLTGDRAPDLDAAAEQYAVAALLFRVVTGTAYLDLDAERDEALTRVVEREPRRFAEVGTAWPQGELALARALAKDPERRFGSMALFRRAVARAAGCPSPGRRDVAVALDQAVVELDVDGPFWEGADPEGARHADEFLRRAAVLTGRTDVHDLALLWSVRAGRFGRTVPGDQSTMRSNRWTNLLQELEAVPSVG